MEGAGVSATGALQNSTRPRGGVGGVWLAFQESARVRFVFGIVLASVVSALRRSRRPRSTGHPSCWAGHRLGTVGSGEAWLVGGADVPVLPRSFEASVDLCATPPRAGHPCRRCICGMPVPSFLRGSCRPSPGAPRGQEFQVVRRSRGRCDHELAFGEAVQCVLDGSVPVRCAL